MCHALTSRIYNQKPSGFSLEFPLFIFSIKTTMIIIQKWDSLPTTYDIIFPNSTRIDLNWFYGEIDALHSDSPVEDEIECNTDTLDYIECGDSRMATDENRQMSVVLVNSSNYHSYTYPVTPVFANLLYTEFYLELNSEIEVGDYQAFLLIDDNSVSTSRFRVEKEKNPYNQYNAERNIEIYER